MYVAFSDVAHSHTRSASSLISSLVLAHGLLHRCRDVQCEMYKYCMCDVQQLQMSNTICWVPSALCSMIMAYKDEFSV